MRSGIFSMICWLLLPVASNSQITQTDNVQHKLNAIEGVGNELKANLVDYFRVYACTFDDTLFEQTLSEAFCDVLRELSPEDESISCNIRDLFAILDLKDVIFLTVPDSKCHNFSHKFAYNKVNGKSYLLGKADLEELMELLENEHFSFSWDSDILRYCRLITILRHPSDYVYFIADIKQLMLQAMTRGMPYYSYLEDLNQFRDMKLEMPAVSREDSVINVTYYAAVYDEILKIRASICKGEMSSYNEEIIGKMPYWYGLDQRLW